MNAVPGGEARSGAVVSRRLEFMARTVSVATSEKFFCAGASRGSGGMKTHVLP